MIDFLEGSLRRLLDSCGADAAIIWSRAGQSSAGSVICAQPPDLVARGSAWPKTGGAAAGLIHRDPAVVASVVPTSLRLELPAAVTAALSLDLAESPLTLLLIWCGSPVEGELPEQARGLIADEIADLARIAAVQNDRGRALVRLQAVADDLDQGMASVDYALDQVDLNAAAARLLDLAPGRVRTAEFAAAMTELEGRALNREQIASMGRELLAGSSAEVDCTWRFPSNPTHVHVSSRALRHGGFSERVWIFDDVSELAQVLDASRAAERLLRAAIDSMIDPHALLESVRDGSGRVVDFVYRSVNRAACGYFESEEGDILGRSARAISSDLHRSGLFDRYLDCLETGTPAILDDLPFYNQSRDTSRRYDIRVTRADANLISLTWRDVTERFLAVERLTASERNYRLLADNSSDVIALIRDGRFVWLSPSVGDVLGRFADYWRGRELRDLIPAEDAATHEARMRAVAAGDSVRGRARLISADGTVHWVHLHARPFRDEYGHQNGVVAAFRPIDDEVAAEQVAEEARRQQARADQRYRRSVQNAAIGMCLVAPDGRLVEVNDALCAMFGYDADTLRQMTWQELTAPASVDADLANVSSILAGHQESYRMIKQYVHADGHLIWAESAVSCVRDEEGQVENFISQITDITATVQANERNEILAQRLREYAERLQTELASAAAYVSSIMPRGLTGRVRVSSRYLPSRELGGDCFDYRWVDDDHLLVYLIDVSGHGLEPALVAVSVHNMLRSGSLTPETLSAPERVLAELNRRFQMDRENDHYFTMWIGVYEASTRTLRYANAAAPPPFAFSRVGDGPLTTIALAATDGPVGIFEDTVFTAHTYTVPPECRILICSDGAYEIAIDDHRSLSYGQFKDLTTRLAATSNPLLDDLIGALHALTPAGAFEDDCSLIELSFD